MTLRRRLERLETAKAAAAAVYGIGYEENGARWVCTSGTILPWDEWQARYPEGRIVKVIVSPYDI